MHARDFTRFLDLLDYYETDPIFRKKKTMDFGDVPKKWIPKFEKFKMKCKYPEERKKNAVYCKNMMTIHW